MTSYFNKSLEEYHHLYDGNGKDYMSHYISYYKTLHTSYHFANDVAFIQLSLIKQQKYKK